MTSSPTNSRSTNLVKQRPSKFAAPILRGLWCSRVVSITPSLAHSRQRSQLTLLLPPSPSRLVSPLLPHSLHYPFFVPPFRYIVGLSHSIFPLPFSTGFLFSRLLLPGSLLPFLRFSPKVHVQLFTSSPMSSFIHLQVIL